MARCTRKTNLEIHHIRRDGGNGLENAEVLCHDCHVNTSTYGTPGDTPEPFSQETKDLAKLLATHQCECNRTTCTHH